MAYTKITAKILLTVRFIVSMVVLVCPKHFVYGFVSRCFVAR